MFDDYVLYRVEALHADHRIQEFMRQLAGETIQYYDVESEEFYSSEEDADNDSLETSALFPSPVATNSAHSGLTAAGPGTGLQAGPGCLPMSQGLGLTTSGFVGSVGAGTSSSELGVSNR
ncbi:hypothetical protein ElyMa_004287500 [Elysia marginata]|uniref:Uncharacterized protein n=1 Tax=Elysia marginata TaxID=1093978 RepID=A0AAV4GXD1_9GAST|nr:hypothetical protein ElyMa_004287500 [Elysia marginata]